MSPTFNLTSFSFIHTSYSIKKSMKRLLFLFPYYKFVGECAFSYIKERMKTHLKSILIYLFLRNRHASKPSLLSKVRVTY
ncbi:hypothetical protein B4134_3883 [Bacillus safensis]|nr:hypothetical protein B4134_3883 [Bacillus safensis]